MKYKNKICCCLPLVLVVITIFSCNNKDTIQMAPETGSFTDPRDGKVYATARIAEKWIMSENLAYKPVQGNYWAYNNDTNNISIYGYLYDWETAKKVAPEGWHLPSREEWTALLVV